MLCCIVLLAIRSSTCHVVCRLAVLRSRPATSSNRSWVEYCVDSQLPPLQLQQAQNETQKFIMSVSSYIIIPAKLTIWPYDTPLMSKFCIKIWFDFKVDHHNQVFFSVAGCLRTDSSVCLYIYPFSQTCALGFSSSHMFKDLPISFRWFCNCIL